MTNGISTDNQYSNLPMVAVVILNWNGLEDTLACLKSMEEVDYPQYKIVIIDNGSSDCSAETIQEAFPQHLLIPLSENSGFAGGNNVGIQYAQEVGAEYVLLLNNDVEVDPSFLKQLVEAAESDPHIGIVGPTIYYYEQPGVTWSAGGWVDWKRGDTFMLGMNEVDEGQYGHAPRRVDWVTGCAMLIKTSVLEQTGPLDERFFAYYEEAELCVRTGKAGFSIYHVPQARIWHKISPASRESSPQVNYYMSRNRLLFLKLTQMGSFAWFHTLAIEFGIRLANWTINPKWRSKAKQRKALIQAMRDYFRSRFGKVDITAQT